MLQVRLMTQHRIHVQQTYLVTIRSTDLCKRWFKNNHLKANPGKSHILLSINKHQIFSIDGIPLAASSHEKLLGVIVDSELIFENHIKELRLKVSKKINALCHISISMSLEKPRTLMKAFIEPQFNIFA